MGAVKIRVGVGQGDHTGPDLCMTPAWSLGAFNIPLN